ncbi:MAG TPA: hypothetical protein VFH27_08865 [Longimicrobiaceae bacterium]|nr:hypothetical protein [Longimicrobiaceae bacterium]
MPTLQLPDGETLSPDGGAAPRIAFDASCMAGGAAPSITLADTLRVVEAHVPAALVGDGARARVMGVAARLPAALSRWAYLECRLAEGAAQVDASVVLDEDGRDVVAGANPAIGLPGDLLERDEWRRVRALCRAWAGADADVAAWTTGVWLEFDVPADAGTVPVPGVFVYSSHEALRPGPLPTAPEGARRALEILRGSTLPAELARGLDRCWASLPPGAHAPHVGAMLSRGAPSLRVCVTGAAREEVPGFLADAGWPGDAAALARLLSELEHDGAPEPAMVQVDMAGSANARVGIEYALDRAPQASGALPRGAFLDALVRRGLCAPAKRAALAEWPGAALHELAHQLWPSVVSRRVNHVKLVLGASGPVEAKAYLSVDHRIHRPRPAPRQG